MTSTEHDWIACFVRDGGFMGAGGPHNLPEIVQIFRNWVTEGKSRELDSVELEGLSHQTGGSCLVNGMVFFAVQW